MTNATSEPPTGGSAGSDRLATAALSYLRARAVIELATATVVAAAGIAFVPAIPVRLVLWGVLAVAVIAALVIELPWLTRRRVELTSYTATSRFVYLVRGAVLRRTTTISVAQILNVETVQGPLARRFDVVFLRFTCIADGELLGPLAPEAADRVRALVLRGQADDES